MTARADIPELVRDLVRADRRLSSLISRDEVEHLLEYGILRTTPIDATVPDPRAPARSVMLVLAGVLEPRDVTAGSALGPGDLVGGESLLGLDTPVERYLARSPGLLVQLPREVASEIFDRVPGLLPRFFERYRERIVHTTLRSVPALATLGKRDLSNLARRATLAGYRAGTEIVRAGEPGDTVHVVADGVACVRHQVGDSPLNLALLRAGDYFGEWAAITGAPRAATVMAISRVVAVAIDREDFLELIQQHPEVQSSVDLEARHRFDQSREFLARMESDDDVADKLAALEAVVTGQLEDG